MNLSNETICMDLKKLIADLNKKYTYIYIYIQVNHRNCGKFSNVSWSFKPSVKKYYEFNLYHKKHIFLKVEYNLFVQLFHEVEINE